MSSFSGSDHVPITSRERAVSTDINSLQQRAARSLALAMRRMANDRYEWSAGRGQATELTVDGTPMAADILGGLQVQIFTTHLLVDAGTVGLRATTASFEASKDADYMIVNSVGVTSSLILPFTANSDGVDIVEFEVNDTVTSSENRDIYDPLTGLFTASLITKAAEASLTFRIRQGAGGAGFPGVAAGWTPIVVAVHAVAPTNFNNVDFYDVRPMVNERTANPSRVGVPQQMQLVQQCDWNGVLEGGGDYNVSGTFYAPWGPGPESTDQNGGGYRLHGQIGPTLPGTTYDVSPTTDKLTINDAAIWDPGDNPVAAAIRWVYVVTMQPFNLPRWCRYTTGVTRIPGRNMGLYVATVDAATQIKSSGVILAVLLPTAYRLGADTGSTAARVVACVRQSVGTDMISGHCTGGLFRSGELMSGIFRTTGFDLGDEITEEFDLGKPGDSNGVLPGGVIGIEIAVNFFFTITTAGAGFFRWKSEDTTNSVDLQNERSRSFAQYPISTDRVHTEQVDFTFPSEEFPNPSGTGNIGDTRVTCTMEFDAGSGAALATGPSSLLVNGVRFGWA